MLLMRERGREAVDDAILLYGPLLFAATQIDLPLYALDSRRASISRPRRADDGERRSRKIETERQARSGRGRASHRDQGRREKRGRLRGCEFTWRFWPDAEKAAWLDLTLPIPSPPTPSTSVTMGKDGKKKKSNGGKVAVQEGSTASLPVALKPEFDPELDALFSKAVQPAASTSQAAAASFQAKKAKAKAAEVKQEAVGDESSSDDDEDDDDDDDDASLAMSDIEREMEEQGLGLREGEDADDIDDAGSDDDDDDDEEAGGHDDVESSSEPDSDASPPLHETLAGAAGQARVRRKLEERAAETPLIRDQRTIFIGNLPIDIALHSSERHLTNQLKRHVISHSPYPSITRIEAIRFRSVAFSRPTMDYAAESGADAAANEKRRNRSRAFADAVARKEAAEEGKGPANVWLNAKQKRKVAYINQEINEKAKSVNAYVTLSPVSEKDRTALASLPNGSSEVKASKVTPPVLAALLASQLDETLFEGRHLRVDLVQPLPLADLVQSGLEGVLASSSSWTTTEMQSLARILAGGNNRRDDQAKTLFVGNLDFEADEEELRAALEGVLRQERGESPLSASLLQGAGQEERSKALASLPPFEQAAADGDADAGSSKSFARKTWVQSVRLIRDAATQMGKGFGYVRFLDEACVDELMAVYEADEAFLSAARPGGRGGINDGRTESGGRVDFKRRLKLNKRGLRLSRCKGNAGGQGQKGKRKERAAAADSDDDEGEDASRTTATPQRKDTKRRRSMGAPTPGGSSPSTQRRLAKANAAGDVNGTPSKKVKTTTAAGTSASGIIANPSPAQPRTAADLARLELKRNDPARQAKRLAKKQKKRDEIKGKASGAAAAVNLKKVAGKMKKKERSKGGK